MTTPQNNYRKVWIYFLTLNAAFGYAFYAYNFCVFNSLQEYIENYIFPEASTFEISLIPSSLDAGAVFGSFLAGLAVKKWGRRKIMMIADLLGIVATSLTLVAYLPIMVVGKFIAGFVGGANTVMVPLYIVEMSPLALCGATGSVATIMLEIFALLAFAVGFIVPSSPSGGIADQVWRILFFIPAIINMIRLLYLKFIFKHETPFYSIQKNKVDNAMKALKQLFTSDVEPEYKRVAQDVQTATLEGHVRFKDLFTKTYRRNLFICSILAIIQQFCGTAVIFVFSNDILRRSTSNPVFFSTLMAVISLAIVIASFKSIDKFGRRSLILIGISGISLSLLSFGFVVLGYGEDHTSLKFILIVWTVFYQMSLASLTFLYISEALPDIGVGFCITANWISGFIISQFFLPTVEEFGLAVPFLFFAVLCLCATFIFWKALEETRGRTKTEIIAAYARYGNPRSML